MPPQKIQHHRVERGGLFHVGQVAGAGQADIFRAGDARRHFFHHQRRGVAVVLAGDAQHRRLDAGEVLAPVEGDDGRKRGAIGTLDKIP